MAEPKLTQIHIADNKTDEIIDFIPEQDFWNDERKRSLKDNRDTFDFETFATESYSGALEERNRIIIPNKYDDSYSEFIIEEAAQILDDGGLHFKAAYTTASYLELRKLKQIPPQTVNALSPEAHVDFALAGTEWQKGEVDYGENHTTVLTAHMDAYSYLLNIAAWSGMELSFRVEHDGYHITGRYVDLIDRAGTWRGHEAVFGKDLLSIERRRKFDAVVSALIGLGPDNSDGTPREEVYVESDEALARWGRKGQHLVEVFEPTSEDENISPTKLFELTQEELNRRISHQSEYVATIATLSEALDVEPSELRFGDIIRIKDEEFNPPIYLEARIHEMTESIKAYGDSEVVLGDFTEFTEDEVKSILARLQKSLADKISNAELAVAIDSVETTQKVTQPTPPTDTDVIWIDSSDRPLITKVYVGAVEGWVPIMPSTAEEIGADPAGSADEALAFARADILEVSNELEGFRNEYDDFMADGFISRSEALSIERHIAALNSEKSDVDADYTVTYANVKLTGTPKTSLASAKTAYNNAHASLISTINTAIADGYSTPAEATSVDNAFNAYASALGSYSTARANATKEITVKSSADAKAEAITAAATDAQTKATNAQNAAIAAANTKAEAEREVAKAYADGIVSDEEDARIVAINNASVASASDAQAKANAAAASAQTYADTQLNALSVTDRNLVPGTEAEWFTPGIASGSAYGVYKSTLSSVFAPLVGKQLMVSFDAKVETVDGTPGQVRIYGSNGAPKYILATKSILGVTTEWARYETSISVTENLANAGEGRIEFYGNTPHTTKIHIRKLKLQIGTKATPWTPAFEDITAEAKRLADLAEVASKAHADALKLALDADINTLETSLGDFESEVNSTFKDGIIQEAEAKAIEKYKNSINAQKIDLDNRYTSIYADTALTGTAKTNLLNAKNDYNSAHSSLIAEIDLAISDGKTTLAEKSLVDTRFTSYRTVLGLLTKRLEEAITALVAAKDVVVKGEAATDASMKVDAIEIGGRNLLSLKNKADSVTTLNGLTITKTGYEFKIQGTNTNKTSSYGIGSGWLDVGTLLLEPGKTYTLSTDKPLPTGVYLGWNGNNAAGTAVALGYLMGNGTKKSVTYTVPSDYKTTNSGFFGIQTVVDIVDITFKIKLEKGTKATDWTPAPEDVLADAALDAQAKADAAQAAADAYSAAQSDLAKIEAMAYADGVITDEEQARIEDAQNKLDEAKAYAEQKAAEAVEAIDNSDLATKEELDSATEEIREQLTSRGGANLLRNSIGYAELDFWSFTTSNLNVKTIMGEALTTLGFGCGFYFPADGIGKGIQQVVNVVEGEEYTLGWYTNRASTGSFTVDILEDTTVIASSVDISAVGAGYTGNFVTFTPTTGSVIVRLTAAGTAEMTVTGLMLGLGNLPMQWTLASGELYNAFVRVDDKGLLVLGLDASGNVERKTIMSPEEFAGYYDENRDGNFEKVFWLNKDETVTKKLRALEEITMGTIKIVRVESAANRGWAFVPIVEDDPV